LTDLSSEEETNNYPSHEKLTDLTPALWALIVTECPSLKEYQKK
jgi:hypothetical protein